MKLRTMLEAAMERRTRINDFATYLSFKKLLIAHKQGVDEQIIENSFRRIVAKSAGK
jgi:hypothetical protein